MIIIGDDGGDSYSLHMSGSASTLPAEDAEDDIIKQLHAVVAEITGKPVEAPERRRMGFL